MREGAWRSGRSCGKRAQLRRVGADHAACAKQRPREHCEQPSAGGSGRQVQLSGRITSLCARADMEELVAGTDTAKLYSVRADSLAQRVLQAHTHPPHTPTPTPTFPHPPARTHARTHAHVTRTHTHTASSSSARAAVSSRFLRRCRRGRGWGGGGRGGGVPGRALSNVASLCSVAAREEIHATIT